MSARGKRPVRATWSRPNQMEARFFGIGTGRRSRIGGRGDGVRIVSLGSALRSSKICRRQASWLNVSGENA